MMDESTTCIELALEGERLCKSGDFQGGVAFFEAAVKIGTQDMRTLSAIYSQLGNAYFYLGDYNKAKDFHKLDLTLAKSMGDTIGQGKASGNLGNTLKMLGQFDEAVHLCKNHLDISIQLNDKVGEGRALYNIGNIYHTRGKHMAKFGHQDPGEFPEDVKEYLRKAVEYYEKNLELMTQLGDKSACGRACGNLGNTHYLLGNFSQAVDYHNERLIIATDFNDKAAQRRAHCNLGNAHIFLGEFEKAVKNYKETLSLAQELDDRLVEAQACYSLGNTFTLLRDYKTAIEYHLRHLQIAQELRDRIGEGRACWSLGHALTALGDHFEALNYAEQHLKISRELGDRSGETTAKISITDLRKLIGEERKEQQKLEAEVEMNVDSTPELSKNKRMSMQSMELLNMTPDMIARKQTIDSLADEAASSNFALNILPNDQKQPNFRSQNQINVNQANRISSGNQSADEDNFFDLLINFQSSRMDEQRCSIDTLENKENERPEDANKNRNRKANLNGIRSVSNPGNSPSSSHSSRRNSNPSGHQPDLPFGQLAASSAASSAGGSSDTWREDLFDMIAGIQSRRMDEQRAALPPMRRSYTSNGPESLPGQRQHQHINHPQQPIHQEQHVEQENQINRGPNNHNNNNPRTLQRMATTGGEMAGEMVEGRQSRQMSLGGNVNLDDDFFDMLMRCQASRLEDQRSTLPSVFENPTVGVVNNGNSRRGSLGSPTSLGLPQNKHRTPALIRPLSMGSPPQANEGSTVPDDDFFSLILRFQAGRIEDQRSCLPNLLTQHIPEDEPMRRQSGSSPGGSSSRRSSNGAGSQSDSSKADRSRKSSSKSKK